MTHSLHSFKSPDVILSATRRQKTQKKKEGGKKRSRTNDNANKKKNNGLLAPFSRRAPETASRAGKKPCAETQNVKVKKKKEDTARSVRSGEKRLQTNHEERRGAEK